MAKLLKLEPNKTYATEANAIKAVEKIFPGDDNALRYFIMRTEEGRFFPVFVGMGAIQAGTHFHFNTVN
jgi:hypothetical protein